MTSLARSLPERSSLDRSSLDEEFTSRSIATAASTSDRRTGFPGSLAAVPEDGACSSGRHGKHRAAAEERLARARTALRHTASGRKHIVSPSHGFWGCGLLGLGSPSNRVQPGASISSFSERMVTLLVRSSLDLFYVTTEDGGLLFVSATVSSFLAHTSEELRGRNVFDLIHPDEQQFAYDMLRSLHSENQSDIAWVARPKNFRIQRKDLTYVWVEMRICTDGELLYIVQRDLAHIRAEGEFVAGHQTNGQEVRELLANVDDDKTRDYLLQGFTSVRRASGDNNRASITKRTARTSAPKLPGGREVGRISVQSGLDSGVSAHTQNVRALRHECHSWDELDSYLNSALDILDRRLIMYMFHSMNVLRLFNVEVATCRAWVEQVETHYKDNPFHNFRHAFTVLHKTWMFLYKSDLRANLQDVDVFALLFAAVSHDLEHPGTTNNFHVNSMTDLALMYNDNSVLENHHCSVAFRILVLPGCALLSGLEKEETKEFRRLVIEAILGTDMKHHKAVLARLKTKLDEKTGALSETNFNPTDLEDRVLLATYILHSADLSNPLAQPDVSKRTAQAVSQEFDAQAAREKELGLPVTVLVADSDYSKAKMEMGFIDFVVRPLYVILANIAPELRECLELVDASKEMWHEIVRAIDKKNGKEERKTVLSKSTARTSHDGSAAVWQSGHSAAPSSSFPGGKPVVAGLPTQFSNGDGEHR